MMSSLESKNTPKERGRERAMKNYGPGKKVRGAVKADLEVPALLLQGKTCRTMEGRRGPRERSTKKRREAISSEKQAGTIKGGREME